MKEKIKSLEELKERSLYIIEDDDIVVENNIEKMCKEKNILISDLAKLTGLSRQNINAVTKNKMKPGIDFALKCSFVLGVPVEEIFTLTDNAWVKPYKKGRDSTLYVDVINLEIIGNTEKRKQIQSTGYEFYDLKEQAYLSKSQRDSLSKTYVEDNLAEKTETIKARYANKKISLNKINSITIEELKHDFNERYIRVYKKLGEKLDPYVID